MCFDEIKRILSAIDDPVIKLEMVMDFGKHLAPVPNDAVCSEIKGCTSRVEICRKENMFFGRADSAIVRGIVAIFIAIVDGKTPSQIKEMDLRKMFSSLNLNLGAGRMNGVDSMILFLQNL